MAALFAALEGSRQKGFLTQQELTLGLAALADGPLRLKIDASVSPCGRVTVPPHCARDSLHKEEFMLILGTSKALFLSLSHFLLLLFVCLPN